MATFTIGQKGALDLKVYMRATDKWLFTNRMSAKTWSAAEAVLQGELRRPTVANGFVFQSNGGRSGATEPTWVADEGESTQDGSIEWIAVPDKAALDPGETITASAWSASDGVVLGTDSDTGYEPAFDGETASVYVIGFADGFAETSFTLTNVIATSKPRTETAVLKVGFVA